MLLGALLSFVGLPRVSSANPDVYEPARDPGVGVILISWWDFGASGATVWEQAVEDVHAHGFGHVTICPVRFVDLTTGAVRVSNGSQSGPRTEHIEAAVARAVALGIEVLLNPFVEPDGFSTWRGGIDFVGTAKAQFWQDYEDYLVEVADIAEHQGARAMTVGSELKMLVQGGAHNANWSSAIAAVDATFAVGSVTRATGTTTGTPTSPRRSGRIRPSTSSV